MILTFPESVIRKVVPGCTTYAGLVRALHQHLLFDIVIFKGLIVTIATRLLNSVCDQAIYVIVQTLILTLVNLAVN